MDVIDAAAESYGTPKPPAVPASIRTLEKRHHQLHQGDRLDPRLDVSQFAPKAATQQQRRPRSSMDSPRTGPMFDPRAMQSSPKPFVGACGGFGAAWTTGPVARLA